MSKYEQKEQEGREMMLDLLHTHYLIDFTTDLYDTVDFRMTAITHPDYIYVGDLKAYLDPLHPRYLTKYEDYMIDYNKLREIKKKALNEERIPLLIGLFEDCLAVWNLNSTEWEDNWEWRLVNKKGVDYGQKEWELMAHLPTSSARIIPRTPFIS